MVTLGIPRIHSYSLSLWILSLSTLFPGHLPLKHVYFIRHGQAYNNIIACEDRPDVKDPELTELGIRQANMITCTMKLFIDNPQPPELVIFSPLRRTIQTLNASFGSLCHGETASKSICLAMSDLQEDNNGRFACDTGFPPAQLAMMYPFLDFSTLPPTWMTDGASLPPAEKIRVRHDRLRKWLSSRREHRVAIVAHQGTIQGAWFVAFLRRTRKLLLSV